MNWNERYEKGDIPWEKGEAAPPVREIAERLGESLWGEGPIMVPGCGFGHDARWLADQGMEVVGLDVSEVAIARASELSEEANPTFAVGDFFEAREGEASALFEHTCFCAIDPSQRERYVTAAARWLPPGGHFVAIFFLNPGRDGGPPFGVSREELDERFGPDFVLIEEWEPTLSYPGREGRELVRVYRRK